MLQGGAQAFEKFGTGDGALDVPESFAEIIGESAVVSAADEGIGGCLVVFAAGEQHMILGIVRSADFLKFQIVFTRLPYVNIRNKFKYQNVKKLKSFPLIQRQFPIYSIFNFPEKHFELRYRILFIAG